MFKEKRYEINWEEVEMNQNPNEVYNIFLEKIRSLYNHFFPEKKYSYFKKRLKKPLDNNWNKEIF